MHFYHITRDSELCFICLSAFTMVYDFFHEFPHMYQRAYKLIQSSEIHLEVQCVCVNKPTSIFLRTR